MIPNKIFIIFIRTLPSGLKNYETDFFVYGVGLDSSPNFAPNIKRI